MRFSFNTEEASLKILQAHRKNRMILKSFSNEKTKRLLAQTEFHLLTRICNHMWYIELQVLDALPSKLVKQAAMLPLEFRRIKRRPNQQDKTSLNFVVKRLKLNGRF